MGPTPRVSDLVGLGWGLKIYRFNKFSDVAGSGPHFENHCFKVNIAFSQGRMETCTVKRGNGAGGTLIPPKVQKPHQNLQIRQAGQKLDPRPDSRRGKRTKGPVMGLADLFLLACCLPTPSTVLEILGG